MLKYNMITGTSRRKMSPTRDDMRHCKRAITRNISNMFCFVLRVVIGKQYRTQHATRNNNKKKLVHGVDISVHCERVVRARTAIDRSPRKCPFFRAHVFVLMRR